MSNRVTHLSILTNRGILLLRPRTINTWTWHIHDKVLDVICFPIHVPSQHIVRCRHRSHTHTLQFDSFQEACLEQAFVPLMLKFHVCSCIKRHGKTSHVDCKFATFSTKLGLEAVNFAVRVNGCITPDFILHPTDGPEQGIVRCSRCRCPQRWRVEVVVVREIHRGILASVISESMLQARVAMVHATVFRRRVGGRWGG